MVLMLLLGFASFTVSADVGGSNGSKYICMYRFQRVIFYITKLLYHIKEACAWGTYPNLLCVYLCMFVYENQ